MERRAISLYLASILTVSAAASAEEQAPTAHETAVAIASRIPTAAMATPGGNGLEQTRAELAQAIGQLDAFLNTGAAYKATGWKRYLQWNDLVSLTREQPAPPDLASALLAKLKASHVGLDMAPFTRVRDALDEYVSAAATAAPAITPGNPRQAPLVDALGRSDYGSSNLFGYASHRLAAAGIEDYVDQVTGVRDNILGTDLHGTARLTGRTTVAFNEDPHAASMRILLGGTAVSRNIGYNGPVTVHTTGVTSVSGQKYIAMTANGLVGYRATAACTTNSTIHDICARCGLIEKIAWKRAGRQKHEAEAIGSQHAAARVANQMDYQAAGMIAEQNARYHEKFREPLMRRGEFPEELAFSSTRERLQVRMLQAGPGLAAAPDNPPEQPGDFDAAVRAHESVVTNFGQGLLGGYELTDLRLEKLIRDDLDAELPEELRVTLPDGTLDQDKDPWSIIFAKEQPVRARFENGGLAIAIRADGFTRGEGDTPGKYRPAITELLEISAAYTIDKTPEGATLKRQDDVRVRFPNRDNPDQITFRDSPIVTFIRRKFSNLFKEEFVGKGIELKGRLARAGRLRLQDIKSDQAWLSVGWMLDSSLPPAAERAE